MLSARDANRRYFQEAYRTGEHGWAVETPSPYAVDFLTRLSAWVPGGRLLDIGCGEGRHAFAAARLGFRVTAIDYEPLALERARRLAKAKAVTGVSFRRADLFSMPCREACFDVVLDYGCLHHQRKTDWTTYRTRILLALKPRGFYILSAFSPKFRLFRESKRRWHIAYGAYRRCFTAKDLARLFDSDFETLDRTQEPGENGGFWHVLMRRR
jgi:2-polyprenyl-3-methyl-5-hydroxy-6-metoxy-1,4-benzoquinol methylase